MASGGVRSDTSPALTAAFDEMRATAGKPRRIALLGSAPSSIKLAPFDDASWEFWGCSPGCAQHLKPGQVHAWFEIHAFDKSRTDLDTDYIAFMRAIKGPVYTIAPVPELPNSVAFPLDAMIERFGNRFFTSTVSYMLALAIAQDDPPSEIGLWGIDMAANSEYFTQKPACHYFFGLAEQAGIRLTVPPQSDLMQPLPLYGFHEVTPMARKLAARHDELTARIANMRAEHNQHAARANALAEQIKFFEGVLDDLQYIRNTWVSL